MRQVGSGASTVRYPRSVLVVVTRRIGDVLLATPLIRSIKAAWPEASIDALVFAGTEGVLEGNPDLRKVLAIAERPRRWAHARFIAGLAWRYDVALSCQAGDRATLYAWIAGRMRIGLVEPARTALWKSVLLSRTVALDDFDTHAVATDLALADALGIAPRHEVVVSWSKEDETRATSLLAGRTAGARYAVLHVHPKFNYKMWHADGWIRLAEWLVDHGLTPVLTGSSDSAEVAFVHALAARMPSSTINLAGQTTLAETASLIAGASLFVGPDTVTTHVAAALSVPTVALFGPSNPVRWGPWPQGFHVAASPKGTLDTEQKSSPAPLSPWRRVGTQEVAHVHLVQGRGACVPCRNEGCDRHVRSYSACLQQMPAETVIAAVEAALGRVPNGRAGRHSESAAGLPRHAESDGGLPI